MLRIKVRHALRLARRRSVLTLPQRTGNETRFVNDFRGVLERFNAVFELRSWEVKDGQGKIIGEGRRMAVWAGPKGIEKGSEICVSYGRGFWSERRKESAAQGEGDDEAV